MPAYTGAWLTQSQQVTQVDIHPGISGQHSTPSPDPNVRPGQIPNWQSTVEAPDLPKAIMPGSEPVQLETGIGPVDHEPDMGTGYGPGISSGLGELGSQDQAAPYHSTDLGAYAAHHWIRPIDRDGVPHVETIELADNAGDSESQVRFDRTGYGQPIDPNVQLGTGKLKRWYDRFVDYHRWGAEYRPLRPRYARPPRTTQVNAPDQHTPHGPSIMGFNPSTMDRFVAPQMRRTPGPWDEGITTDGTVANLAGVATGYGLTQYGL
jgi:hypothetical protein